jgi:hypothetical protein
LGPKSDGAGEVVTVLNTADDRETASGKEPRGNGSLPITPSLGDNPTNY